MFPHDFLERCQLLGLCSITICSSLPALLSSDVHVRGVASGANFAAKTPPESGLGSYQGDLRDCIALISMFALHHTNTWILLFFQYVVCKKYASHSGWKYA
jgi:hypothetical protein